VRQSAPILHPMWTTPPSMAGPPTPECCDFSSCAHPAGLAYDLLERRRASCLVPLQKESRLIRTVSGMVFSFWQKGEDPPMRMHDSPAIGLPDLERCQRSSHSVLASPARQHLIRSRCCQCGTRCVRPHDCLPAEAASKDWHAAPKHVHHLHR